MERRSWKRPPNLWGGLLALAVVVAGVQAPWPANAMDCQGRDVLADLKESAPESFARIVAAERHVLNTEAELWRIEAPGVRPSYLLGTVHMTDTRVATLSPATRAALSQVSAVAVEVADLSPEAAASAARRSGKLMFYGEDQSLARSLPQTEVEAIKVALTNLGAPADMLGHSRPWLITMMLALSRCERERSQQGLPVLDVAVTAYAREHAIAVVGLETLDTQLAAMAGVPETDQLEILRAAVHLAPRTDDMMETTIGLYQKRRMGAAWALNLELARAAGVDLESYRSFEQKLILERNTAMTERAKPLIAKGGALIAVGALHLVGDQGLVARLRAAGLTVVPIE